MCNEEHRYDAFEQLVQFSYEPKAIVLEPVGKNTAPALALASFYAGDELLPCIVRRSLNRRITKIL